MRNCYRSMSHDDGDGVPPTLNCRSLPLLDARDFTRIRGSGRKIILSVRL